MGVPFFISRKRACDVERKGHILGLTGSIASGKSAVSAILEELGAYIVDCDLISREVVAKGSQTLKELVQIFGSEILYSNGELNRQKLAKLIFADEEAREKLNSLVHPVIWQKAFAEAGRAAEEGKVVFIVAPLLFEHGAEAAMEGVWVVDIKEELQLKRLCKRDNLSPQEAKLRISAQMSSADKVARASEVIDNNINRQELKNRVIELWQERIAPFL